MLNRPIVCTAALVALCALTQCTPATCDRRCLTGMVDLYMDALQKHDPSVLPVSDKVKFTENGVPLKLGQGFWNTAGASTYRLYAIDPESGGAALEAVVGDASEPAHFLLRLKVSRKRITEVETAVVHKAQAGFYSPEKLRETPELFTQNVPDSERNTREQLLAAADAYFTAIDTEGTPEYKRAPFAPGMNRFENGTQTTNISVNGGPVRSADEQLDQALFKGLHVTDRRYPVVDVERGIVLGLVLFHLAAPRPAGDTIFIAEMFKISGGKLREIQAIIADRPAQVGSGWN